MIENNPIFGNKGLNLTEIKDLSLGVYEGEWVIDRQTVATAQLVVTPDSLEITLPERAVLQSSGVEALFSGDKMVGLSSFDFQRTPQVIGYCIMGISKEANYANVYSNHYAYSDSCEGVDSMIDVPAPDSFSFGVCVDEVFYRIDLLGGEKGTAMYAFDTGLWSLGIPVDRIVITNLHTREQQIKTLSSSMMLIYNAKKKVG